jgi:hypothetical protein
MSQKKYVNYPENIHGKNNEEFITIALYKHGKKLREIKEGVEKPKVLTLDLNIEQLNYIAKYRSFSSTGSGRSYSFHTLKKKKFLKFLNLTEIQSQENILLEKLAINF